MDTSDFEAMERNGWAKADIAKTYADGFDCATARVAEALADAVAVTEGHRVLDLCTGHGVVAAALLRRGAEVTGLDFSPAMISLAEANVPDAIFVQGDAMAMAFADQSFDAATIGFGVPHFPDPAKGLAEAARVLNPGGRLAFSIWYGDSARGAFAWNFEAFDKFGDPSLTIPAGPDAHQLVDPDLAERMMSDAGFEDVTMTEVASEIRVETPEDLFDVFYKGAVRAAERLVKQSQAVRDAMKAEMASRTRSEGRKEGEVYFVPAPSVVVSGRRR